MTGFQIKTAIEEGWLDQEFAGELSQCDDEPDAESYVRGFVENLRDMDRAGIISGFPVVIRDGRIVGDLAEIRLV